MVVIRVMVMALLIVVVLSLLELFTKGEYVVPKNVLESQRGSSLVNALESMRTNRPQPFSNFGFANGGFAVV